MSAPAGLGQLRWRCRRGMKELDILLSRYVNERFCGATSGEQAAFGRLLEAADSDIYAYCMGYQPPPAEFAALIERITASPSPP
ncbi:MAG TPA: succinate dehydrogenase assembly factor 2 [Steroidobacteraceae bacterium]|jgi:antitoxin CptB|nr:succinate dehydrogenase assembly factor 2 [Steroidobacteraceae bacterium]